MGRPTSIQIGYISSAFGIKGWHKVYSYCRPLEQILEYATWQLHHANQQSSYTLENGKTHGSGVIAKLSGIDTRTQAESLVGAEIWVSTEELPTLADSEFYWFQLIGLSVITLDGQALGIVQRLMETGSNDVLVVTNDSATNEILVPYIWGEVVKNVDLDQKILIVDWQVIE